MTAEVFQKPDQEQVAELDLLTALAEFGDSGDDDSAFKSWKRQFVDNPSRRTALIHYMVGEFQSGQVQNIRKLVRDGEYGRILSDERGAEAFVLFSSLGLLFWDDKSGKDYSQQLLEPRLTLELQEVLIDHLDGSQAVYSRTLYHVLSSSWGQERIHQRTSVLKNLPGAGVARSSNKSHRGRGFGYHEEALVEEIGDYLTKSIEEGVELAVNFRQITLKGLALGLGARQMYGTGLVTVPDLLKRKMVDVLEDDDLALLENIADSLFEKELRKWTNLVAFGGLVASIILRQKKVFTGEIERGIHSVADVFFVGLTLARILAIAKAFRKRRLLKRSIQQFSSSE